MRSFFYTVIFLASAALVFWLSGAYLNSPDADACAARAAYCRQLAIDGKAEEIRAQMGKIRSAASKNLAASYLYSFSGNFADAKNLSEFERDVGAKVEIEEAACVRLLRDIKSDRDFSDENMLRRIGEANALPNGAKKALAYVAISERYANTLGDYGKNCVLSKALEIFEKYPYPTLCEREMLDAGAALIRMGESKYFMRLIQAMNVSDDLIFMIYDGVENPEILAEYKRAAKDKRFFEKRRYLHSAIGQSSYPSNFRLTSMAPEDFSAKLPYMGSSFYIYWGKEGFAERFRYPALAYIAFRYGLNNIYENFAQKSILNLEDDAINARKTVYCAYAAKAFGRLGDVERMKAVLKSLPPGERSAAIRRAAPYCDSEAMGLLR